MEREDLTEEQTKAVDALSGRNVELRDSHPYYDDYYFSRWLVGANWDVDKAHQTLAFSHKTRREMGLDYDHIEEYGGETRDVLEHYCPTIVFGADKQGCPVFYERTGLFEMKSLLKVTTMDGLLRHHMFKVESAERAKWAAGTRADGKRHRRHYVILDLKGIGWDSANGGTVDMVKTLVGSDEIHFPDSIEKMFLVNAPWLFNTVWKAIKTVLSKRTVARIEILGEDWLDTVGKVIDLSQIPSELGGKAPGENIAPGGKIPESYFRGIEIDDKTHEQAVGRADSHELRVCAKKDATLNYEFWTKSNDIGFAVKFVEKGKDVEDRTDLKANERVQAQESHQTGSVTAPTDGQFILVFDNSFSTFWGKTLFYKLDLQ